jgi:hypothetical protein
MVRVSWTFLSFVTNSLISCTALDTRVYSYCITNSFQQLIILHLCRFGMFRHDRIETVSLNTLIKMETLC